MDGADLFGVPSSSLDTQQTTSGGKAEGTYELPPANEGEKRLERGWREWCATIRRPERCETVFRHGGWATDRLRVLKALHTANVPARRLERYCACGGDAVVEYSPSAQRHRIKAFYCGDRFCVPCARARSLKVKENLLKWTAGRRVRFVTLTLANREVPLATQLTALLKYFAKVRESLLWRVAVEAGAYVVEIKKGKNSGLWHVHAHCLCVGSFLDQRELSKLWRRVTGDSFVVDVREVKDHDQGVGYVAKYASKGWSQEVLQDEDSLLECVLALRGRRLLGTFGEWRNRKLERDVDAVTDWRVVDRFKSIFDASLRDEPWARAVFRSLGVAAGEVEGNPVFLGPEDDSS